MYITFKLCISKITDVSVYTVTCSARVRVRYFFLQSKDVFTYHLLMNFVPRQLLTMSNICCLSLGSTEMLKLHTHMYHTQILWRQKKKITHTHQSSCSPCQFMEINNPVVYSKQEKGYNLFLNDPSE